jgi:hypothetical protein
MIKVYVLNILYVLSFSWNYYFLLQFWGNYFLLGCLIIYLRIIFLYLRNIWYSSIDVRGLLMISKCNGWFGFYLFFILSNIAIVISFLFWMWSFIHVIFILFKFLKDLKWKHGRSRKLCFFLRPYFEGLCSCNPNMDQVSSLWLYYKFHLFWL